MVENYKIVFLFSGQGSHSRGMGRGLYEGNKVFRETIESCDAIIKNQLYFSLIDELYFKSSSVWEDIMTTHPAILAVELAMLNVFKSMGVTPDFASGSSLGEFAAGVTMGIWDLNTALCACIEQVKAIMRNNVEGGMLSVIGTKHAELKKLYLRHNLFLASDNFEGHFTLSGSFQNIESFQEKLKSLQITFFRLPIRVPFHCTMMDTAIDSFLLNTENLKTLNTQKSGFISGISGEELNNVQPVHFWNAISKHNNNIKVVDYFENNGPCIYIDLGPSGTSATFVKYNLGIGTFSRSFKVMSNYHTEIEELTSIIAFLKEIKAFNSVKNLNFY